MAYTGCTHVRTYMCILLTSETIYKICTMVHMHVCASPLKFGAY